MDEKRQNDQLEPTYSSSVPIRNVALKTRRKQWTIENGSEKGSGISVLMPPHDDDDDIHRNTWNHLTLLTYAKVNKLDIGQLINLTVFIYKMSLEILYLIFAQKLNLALNKQQWLVCRNSKASQTRNSS